MKTILYCLLAIGLVPAVSQARQINCTLVNSDAREYPHQVVAEVGQRHEGKFRQGDHVYTFHVFYTGNEGALWADVNGTGPLGGIFGAIYSCTTN